MSDKSGMWKVWPTENVRGFVPTYCTSRMNAEWEQLALEAATGIEWRITNPKTIILK